MQFVFNDGGRAAAGFKGSADDCVVRSIAIALELPYREVYDAINVLAKDERIGKRQRHRSSSRTGVYRKTYQKFLADHGWEFVACMGIGTGCKVHLHDGELPPGRLIVALSRHITVVIDGVIHDTYDPQRATIICEDGAQRIARRCVYGYYRKKVENPAR